MDRVDSLAFAVPLLLSCAAVLVWRVSARRIPDPCQLSSTTPSDRQIDQLVYQLYSLTDDETRIVQSATA